MQQLVFEAATLGGLIAATFAAMIMVSHGAALVPMIMRTLIIGGSVFLFAVLTGQIVGRLILEQIAKKELEEAKAHEAERQKANLQDSQTQIVALSRPSAAGSVTTTPSEDSTGREAA